MLRVFTSKSANAAKKYFTESLSKGDYYIEDREFIGEWGGKVAKKLNLVGEVDKKKFEQLVDNINPVTGARLNPRHSPNRRVGYDITFSVPKSVSLLYDVTNDSEILEAFRDSVRETMQEMEERLRTQDTGEDGKFKPVTGNMVWAEFVHFEARPVDGVPDPHLHAHCFTMNTTFYEAKERFQAGEFYDLKRSAPYFEAAFDARMANRLVGMGYSIERKEKGWEVEGVSLDLIREFSRRTEQIEREARKRGITADFIKDTLAAETRDSKKEILSYEEVLKIRDERLGEEGKQFFEGLYAEKDLRRAEGKERGDVTPEEAMDYAVRSAFERSSVVDTDRVMAYALKFGLGSVSVEDIKREVLRDGILIKEVDGRRLSTLPEIIESERSIVSLSLETKETMEPLYDGEYSFKDRIFESESAAEQKEAVLHVLKSSDKIIGIDGVAGGGKTTLMKEAVAGIEEGGHKVFVFAPTSKASNIVLRSKGFDGATTVSDLTRKELRDEMRGQVIWIDEAGMLSVHQMRNVFDIAERLDCKKVVLSGDIQQHGAVERGDGFRVLIENGDLNPAQVKKIQRQNVVTHKDYHDVVDHFSRGEVEEAFKVLDKMEAIKEFEPENYLGEAAKDYVECIDRAVLVSPTHAEGERLTDLVRDKLRDSSLLTGEDRIFVTQKNLSWTEAERGDSVRYDQEGLIVQFSENVGSFHGGERVEVVKREGKNVYVADCDGQVKFLDLEQADKFDVFEKTETSLSVGDKVRITRNGYVGRNRVDNGEIYDVVGFTRSGDVKLKGGIILPKDYGNFTYGYCSTSYGAQGMDDKIVISAIGTGTTGAISAQQMYVTVSRGQEEVRIYTDDSQVLRQAVKDGIEMSGLDFESLDDEAEKFVVVDEMIREGKFGYGEGGVEVTQAYVWDSRGGYRGESKPERGYDYGL